MKKLVSILIVFALCFSSLLIIAPIEVKATTYFSETFESYANGWTTGNDSANRIGLASEQVHGGSYSWFINTTALTQYGYAYKACAVSAMLYRVSCWIYISSSVTGINVPFLATASATVYIVRASINYSGGAYYITNEPVSGTYENVSTITADAWHQVEAYVSRTTGKIHYYLDNVKKGGDWSLQNNVSAVNYWLGDQNAVLYYGKYFYDDLSVDDTVDPTDTIPPKYDSISYSSTKVGSSCIFSSNWSDNIGLSGHIFETNNTGVSTNETWSALGTNPAWANVTKTLNTTGGMVIKFRWYCNDSSNLWNDTGANYLTTTAFTVTFQNLYYGTRTLVGSGYWNGTKIINGTSYPIINSTTTFYLHACPGWIWSGDVFDRWLVNGSTRNDGAGGYNPITFTVDDDYVISCNWTSRVMLDAKFTVNNTNAAINDTISFDQSMSIVEYGYLSLLWDWDDGSTQYTGWVSPATHKYNATGLYNVTLTIEDFEGYTDSFTYYSVTITEGTDWYIAPGFILGFVCFLGVGFVLVKKKHG